MTRLVWLRKTRKYRSQRRSTDDGWMHASSNGSMTMRPAASSSRMVRSDRITGWHRSGATGRRRPTIATLPDAPRV